MSKVILTNIFDAPGGREEECLAFWRRAADFMRRQPWFLSTCLHRAVAPGARFAFINMAEWESAEHLAAAVNSPGFIELVTPYIEVFPHYPERYQVVAT